MANNEEFNTLEDLVFSRSFRNWVLKSDAPEAAFWTSWVANNTDKTELITQARAVILALQQKARPLPAATVDNEVQKVLQKLREGRLNLVREVPYRPRILGPCILGRRIARAW